MYVYICDPCRAGNHDKCEENENIPADDTTGGGSCICQHQETRSKFEQSVWDEDK